MRVLITGNLGYVGPVVTAHLRARLPEAQLIGFDAGYFTHCLTNPRCLPETPPSTQLTGDIRTISERRLEGIDAIVHLAAISNDPMGKSFEAATEAINKDATIRLAKLARRVGVRAFVFASSCSIYGSADDGPRSETDAVAPQTAYARSKIGAELALAAADPGGMTVTCLRFATACGLSPRLRLDLVLNEFVAAALIAHKITVLSDGSPWRPLIDVADMARAVEWAIQRDPNIGGQFLSVNTGASSSNTQVRDLANAVAATIPGTAISVNTAAPADKRSYQVDFGLFRKLAPDHQPTVMLAHSIANLKSGLGQIDHLAARIRDNTFVRLSTLKAHIDGGKLSAELNWIPPPSSLESYP